MLLDRWLPAFDVSERHRIDVDVPAARAWEAVRALDLSRDRLVRALFLARGFRRTGALTLDALRRRGFVLLDERPGEEIVLGLMGRFWTPGGGIVRLEPQAFAAFEEPGYAKAVWNFRVVHAGGGGSMVSTETRVRCTDARARRSFRRYWLVVGPFSALIRRRALALIRTEAERAPG